MKKYLLFISFILILFFSGCSFEDNSAIGRNYLKDKGYKVISYEGNVETYQLTEETLLERSYLLLWSVQKADPLEFLSKEVQVEKFIVKNHPLDEWESGLLKSIGETEIRLFIIDSRVVGGISAPVIDGDNTKITSNIWSLEGRDISEVHSMDFNTWKEQLLNRLNEYNQDTNSETEVNTENNDFINTNSLLRFNQI